MTGGRGLGLDFFEHIADIEARFHFVSGLCGKAARGQLFCPEANFVQRVAGRSIDQRSDPMTLLIVVANTSITTVSLMNNVARIWTPSPGETKGW